MAERETRASAEDAEFAEFYQSSYRRVVALVAGVMGGVAEAEDVAQEAFSRALRMWPRLRTDYDVPEAWVRLVAMRLAVDSQRRAGRTARLHLRLAFRAAPAANALVEGVAGTPVGAGLLQLPVRQRQVLVLYYLAGLTVDEISREYDIPLGTVKERLAAGRHRLRAVMEASEAGTDG